MHRKKDAKELRFDRSESDKENAVKYEHDKKEQQEKTSKGKQRASPSETKGLFS